ncbi:MAG: Mrp/NBP35 family ATP-binding protein [Campylobacterota bacterium]|nr:Mrp/NBP35 family ATP-binding protein [Campylobacterota bacterium]
MKERIMDELKKVKFPEHTKSIISLGIVEDVEIGENGEVTVKGSLGIEDETTSQKLRSSITQALEKIEGVKKINVKIAKKNIVPRIKHIVGTTSGKGGVGKTTVSVNIALALSKLGQKVGILDTDIYGPNVPKMMGIEEEAIRLNQEDKDKMLPVEKEGIKVFSIGNLIPKGTALIWRGPLIHKTIEQFLEDVTWGDLDFLVVDFPPGTGDAQLSMAQLTKVTGGIVVTTPQDVALMDAARAVDFFKKLKIPVLGVIENMSYFVCPHCGEKVDIFSHGGGKKLSIQLSLPFLGEIPIDIDIRTGGDEGKPIVVSKPDSLGAKAFINAAKKIIEEMKTLETL